MAWRKYAGRAAPGRMPSDWKSRRRRVLMRDFHVCQISGPGCLAFADEVDHIVPNEDHSLSNLRAVCKACHREKTKQEAADGLRKAMLRGKRPQEPHPGSV
jgi:5-methylcytosine-specific restriction endonuclease McrA